MPDATEHKSFNIHRDRLYNGLDPHPSSFRVEFPSEYTHANYHRTPPDTQLSDPLQPPLSNQFGTLVHRRKLGFRATKGNVAGVGNAALHHAVVPASVCVGAIRAVVAVAAQCVGSKGQPDNGGNFFLFKKKRKGKAAMMSRVCHWMYQQRLAAIQWRTSHPPPFWWQDVSAKD